MKLTDVMEKENESKRGKVMTPEETKRAIEENLDGDLLNIFREYYEEIPNAVQDAKKFVQYWKTVQFFKKLNGDLMYDDLNKAISLHIINFSTNGVFHVENEVAHELGNIFSWFDCIDISAHRETTTIQLGMEIYS